MSETPRPRARKAAAPPPQAVEATAAGAADDQIAPADVVPSRNPPKRWRFVKLSLLGTGIAGAVWAAVASSVVEQGSVMISSTMDSLRGGERIRELEQQLNDSRLATSAFIPLAYRSRQFCFDRIRDWARDKGYKFTPFGDPYNKTATIGYFGTELVLRCVGALQADFSYLVIVSPERLGGKVDALLQEVSQVFKAYGDFPNAVFPGDVDWTSLGPYSRMGYLRVEMPFSVFLEWSKGKFPQPLIDAVWQQGSKQTIVPNDKFSVLITTTPGASIAVRNPEADSFEVLDAGKGWQPFTIIGGIPQYPAPDALVRARVIVSVSGDLYGKEFTGSAETRYLGLDLEARLKRIPGVVDEGNLDELIRNW